MTMCIRLKAQRLNDIWFFYYEFDYDDIFDCLSNWTSSQIEQEIDYLGQNGQWVLIKWDI
jgi:hypothetical protein